MDRCEIEQPSLRVRRFVRVLVVVGLIATADLITKWTVASSIKSSSG